MLREAREDDIPFIRSIQDKPEYRSMIADDPVERLADYIADPNYALLIWDNPKPRGFALLADLENASATIELRRLALADAGKGEGQRLLSALKDHVFGTLQAHRLWLDVAADNLRAIAAYRKAGLVDEGVMREAWQRRDSRRVDLLIMGMLRREWFDVAAHGSE